MNKTKKRAGREKEKKKTEVACPQIRPKSPLFSCLNYAMLGSPGRYNMKTRKYVKTNGGNDGEEKRTI